MAYVDGFVASVPHAKQQEFQEHAQKVAVLFKENGATEVVDCWGNDVPEGKLTSFPLAVKCEPDETVVFSWVRWPSKEVRDAGWAKMMANELMDMSAPPFDGKRLIYGGFVVISSV